jgi:exonuclease III
MKINLLSFNVRGLYDLASIPTLKHYLSASPQIDIILLQEHKLRLQAAQELGAKLWKDGTAWTLDASPGYGNLPHLPGAGKGGISTLLSP